MTKGSKGEIIIYQPKRGDTTIEVKLVEEDVWLTQKQMSALFDKDVRTVNEHILNVYGEGELDKGPTIRKFRIVQMEGNRTVKRSVDHYNLDVIISVGYRVKSARGTQFRIWANKVLKDYLVKGYAINERRLTKKLELYESLKESIKLIESAATSKKLTGSESTGLLKVITDFNYALEVLDKYDHHKLRIAKTTHDGVFRISYKEAMHAVKELKKNAGGSSLFGHEKDESFHSSLNTIYQSFAGKDLYPSIEEKAAHLLYFIVKNHSFIDGNKRIAAFLFVWFLERNNILYNDDGSKRLADNALVALTLMIAISKPEEKDIMIRVIVNLINKSN